MSPAGAVDRTAWVHRGSWVRRAGGLSLRRLLPAAGAGALCVACGVGLLATSGWLITRAAERPPVFMLAVAIGAVQAFSLGRGVARYLQRLAVHGVSLATLGRLRGWLYDTLEPLVPGGLGPRASGVVLASFVSETEVVAEAVAKKATAAIDVAASVGLGSVVAVLVAPGTGAALLTGSAAAVVLAMAAGWIGRRPAQRASEERAELADTVSEAVRAAPELTVYGRQDLLLAQLGEAHRRSRRAARSQALAHGASRALLAWAAGATLIGVVATGFQAHLSGVMLAVVAFVALAVLDQCAALPGALAGAAAGAGAAERLAALARLHPAVHETGADARLPEAPVTAELHAVEVEGILRGVSLRAAAGERVALLGPSGSGKTSALYALLHFLEASKGTASIGGADVAGLTRDTVARHVGWMAEDTHLFAATLAENLRLARPFAIDRELVETLERVGLLRWYRSLPDGLRTPLGAGGRPVSAGERQRLGLARALLTGGGVVLLDEPTAHIDPGSKPAVLSEMLDAANGRALVVVSHDPAVATLVDAAVRLSPNPELAGGR